MMIPYNKPYLTGSEIDYIRDAIASGHISGDGKYSKKAEEWLTTYAESEGALLTHSCTAALEMAALLEGLSDGDEVIMPSYTFVSTANAVVLRGAVPVFVDIRSDTLNIDENLIESAITDKTKAIWVVHYAGVACEMDSIIEIAKRHKLMVVEDAAQALMASYKGKPLGGFGDFSTFSFHETKNINCGEGGALIVNNKEYLERAEIIREKGTNRKKFFRGMVDKYTWVDIGSSYLPSDILAAYLVAQFESARSITDERLSLWNRYYNELKVWQDRGLVRLPVIPDLVEHNGHIFYLLVESESVRDEFIRFMKSKEIMTPFHYVPLDLSPFGKSSCRVAASLDVTHDVSRRLVRLPLYPGMGDEIQTIIDCVHEMMVSIYG